MNKLRILIVEDDSFFSTTLCKFLTKSGYETFAAKTSLECKDILSNTHCDLILLDYKLPDDTGINTLKWIKSHKPQLPVIMMTIYTDIQIAIKAMKLGAYDYLIKPILPDELLETIKGVLTTSPQPNLDKNEATSEYFFPKNSHHSSELLKSLELVAPTDLLVLLQGESGTGKEYAARLIHKLSDRKNKPFVAIDCGVLTRELAGSELYGHIKGAFTGALQNKKGVFEQANGGTLFLDEIGNLDYQVQIMLLRALQEKSIRPIGSSTSINTNVRIICATNENLNDLMANKIFREDLYHRLNEFRIKIPSLEERKADIPDYVHYFIKMANKKLKKEAVITDNEIINSFQAYSWPGNLRELKNVIFKAVLLSDNNKINKKVIPEEIQNSIIENTTNHITGLKSVTAISEREKIIATLLECNNNKSAVAKQLQITRKTLYNKMEKYNI